MRFVINPQMQIGAVDISKIEFDPKSRDEMPQVLRGLQYIYTNILIREEIFSLLEKNISQNVNKKNGRPGMELWKILVLGVIRLNLNWNYDRLHDEANNHAKIREMLGHADVFDKHNYHLQTIKDNVSLLTPELLDQINQIVVRAGHQLIKKKETEELRVRGDSFVVETNVHFPTDINLLYDAMRKIIRLIARLCDEHGLSDWRQSNYNIKTFKKLMRAAQNKKHSKSKNEEEKKKNDTLIVDAHQIYIDTARKHLLKVQATIKSLEKQGFYDMYVVLAIENINYFVEHAVRQINQIERRVIFGEVIPHHEKVFSIFEPHTEWVSKGKAGVPVELGLKVCIMEDQYQFILHHNVMEKETDDQIAIRIVGETKQRFPDIKLVSFDKGFHNPENQKILSEIIRLILPKKGKLSEKDRAREKSDEFRRARQIHSAVESGINALEVHGLDICPDHGIDGFKRYISLAIVARNIQRIGAILKQKEQNREERRRKKYIAQKHAA